MAPYKCGADLVLFYHLLSCSLSAMSSPPNTSTALNAAPDDQACTPPHSPVHHSSLPPEPGAPTATRIARPTTQTPKFTPQAQNGGVRTRFDDTRLIPKYQCKDYDPFLLEDLKDRVFLDYDKFAERILRVSFPTGSTPKAPFRTEDERVNTLVLKVLQNASFTKHLDAFLAMCRTLGSVEHQLYALHAALCNAALEIIEDEYPEFPPIRFFRNDPKTVHGGILNVHSLSPDLLAVFRSMFKSSGNAEDLSINDGGPRYRMAWAMPVTAAEFKDTDSGMYDGRDGHRLLDAGTFHSCFVSFISHISRLQKPASIP